MPFYSYICNKIIAISNDSLQIQKLQKYFAEKDGFTIDDIVGFYNKLEWGLPASTINWRIYNLVKRGILKRIGRGKYVLGQEILFYPIISSTTKKIFSAVNHQYPYARTCIWHTSSLNQFMVHQPVRFQLMLEVEKDVSESVFYFIKEKYKNVYLNPNDNIYHTYISGKRSCIIVKNLISEAPIQEIYKVNTATLEKILVDLYCDTVIYSAYQGNELRNIFNNAFEEYTINIDSLKRYAQRRGKKEAIIEFINQIL